MVFVLSLMRPMAWQFDSTLNIVLPSKLDGRGPGLQLAWKESAAAISCGVHDVVCG